MRLSLTLLLAIGIAISGSTHYSRGDNGSEIVSHAEDANLTVPGEAIEDCGSDLIAASFTAHFQPAVFCPSPIATALFHGAPEEQNSSKEDLKIYKINRALLI